MGFRDQVKHTSHAPQPLRLEGKRVKYLGRDTDTNEHVFLHFRKKDDPPHCMTSYTTNYMGRKQFHRTDWIFVKIIIVALIAVALVLVML